FVEEGARVVVAGLPGGDVPAGAVFVACDAVIPEEVGRLFAETAAALGGLNVLYHVAGGSGRRRGDGALHDCSDDGWRWTIDANLTSTFLTNRAAVRWFLEQKSPGAVLNMASVLA